VIRPIQWHDNKLLLIDQTQLPEAEAYVECASWEETARAIREMVVRGAPAIGIAAAYGMVLAATALPEAAGDWRSQMRTIAQALERTRPTAVNLAWALERMLRCANAAKTLSEAQRRLHLEAEAIEAEDFEMNLRIGRFGAELVPPNASVLTICNTGALATGGHGTALGIIRSAHEAGKGIRVLVCETRPRLQGARLTAWELLQDGIPFELITDNMAGFLMRTGRVTCVAAGADRIAQNGDTANKIGTYSLAVLAHHHGLPFYIAAPTSTVDLSLPDGAAIPIEFRDPEEVTHLGSTRIAAAGAPALNPAFDITPAELITAIVTEAGILTAPYAPALTKAFRG
jgi:methylthioribose-1-phosphate isomerase